MLAAFSADSVKQRMDQVRDYIMEVRSEYHSIDSQLMQGAAHFIRRLAPSVQDQRFLARLAALVAKPRGFVDLHPHLADKHFSALWLYTSSEGYDGAFTHVKRTFRDPRANPDELRLATFIVELINIDLFNFWYAEKGSASFDGWVWRGLWMTAQDFAELYSKAYDLNIKNRYRSIPLALDSSSTSREEALNFLKERKGEEGEVPVLQKIRVLGLTEPSLACYIEAYPTSLVSTICATQISKLSAFPKEGEVLLRGGFYQLLDVLETSEMVHEKPLKVVEMVMMNTNRDHPSTPQGSHGDAPRKLIGSLVTSERIKFCRDYHEGKGQLHSANLYAEALEMESQAFRRQYGQNPPWG